MEVTMIQEFSNKIDLNRLTSAASFVPDFHIHDFYELFILIKGELSFFIQDSCYHISAGTMLVINDLELHKAVNLLSEPYERIYIHIPTEFFLRHENDEIDLAACFKKRNAGENNLFLLDESQLYYIIQQYENMKQAAAYPLKGSTLLLESYLIQLLVFINNLLESCDTMFPPCTYSENTQIILRYIQDHLLDTITLDVLADHLCLNKHYMCHMFKKETGTTIFNYILLLRLAKAKSLLMQGKNVTESCSGAGFKDYTNFITSFKKFTGYTPKKYQKLNSPVTKKGRT